MENICLEINIVIIKIWKHKKNWKWLGQTFTHDLGWSNKVNMALSKAAGHFKGGLVTIKKLINVNKDFCLKLITAVYYGARVLMMSFLKCK